MKVSQATIIYFRKLETARWWPSRTPEEGCGRLLKIARMSSGAVMAQVAIMNSDGNERLIWIPWSRRFVEVQEVHHV